MSERSWPFTIHLDPGSYAQYHARLKQRERHQNEDVQIPSVRWCMQPCSEAYVGRIVPHRWRCVLECFRGCETVLAYERQERHELRQCGPTVSFCRLQRSQPGRVLSTFQSARFQVQCS